MDMSVDYQALKNGGFMRQVQKDHFSLRLKVVGGNLTVGQLLTIAEVGQKYGVGRVHLTSRQGLEIPFIRLADVEAVKAELAAGGVRPGVCGPRVRTVTACQGRAVCPYGLIDAHPLAEEISERYFGRQLPHKFKFGVTGCLNNCLKAEENDLGIKGGYLIEWLKDVCSLCGVCVPACREGAIAQTDDGLRLDRARCNHCGRCVKACPAGAWRGEPGYLLSFGGTFGNRIARGESFLPFIRDKAVLFRAADAALSFYDRHGRPGERFRTAIERSGWDVFKKELEAAYSADCRHRIEN